MPNWKFVSIIASLAFLCPVLSPVSCREFALIMDLFMLGLGRNKPILRSFSSNSYRHFSSIIVSSLQVLLMLYRYLYSRQLTASVPPTSTVPPVKLLAMQILSRRVKEISPHASPSSGLYTLSCQKHLILRMII